MSDPDGSSNPLPSPAERPGADMIIYDGHCRVCTASSRSLARADRRGRLAFLSLHDPEVARRWPDLSHEELTQYLFLITPGGERFRGADALRYLSTRLPSLYWAAPFLHLPGSMPLWRRLYSAFAKRRFLFGSLNRCDDGACSVHRPS